MLHFEKKNPLAVFHVYYAATWNSSSFFPSWRRSKHKALICSVLRKFDTYLLAARPHQPISKSTLQYTGMHRRHQTPKENTLQSQTKSQEVAAYPSPGVSRTHSPNWILHIPVQCIWQASPTGG